MTTRRVPSERRAAALAEMSALLSSSLDYERTLPRLVRLAVPALGDLCAIDLLHDESGLHRVACAHVDAAREPLVHEIGTKHAGDSTGGQGVSAVIRTRRPVLVARATEADRRAARPKRRTARRTNSSRRSRTSCATRSTPCTGGRH